MSNKLVILCGDPPGSGCGLYIPGTVYDLSQCPVCHRLAHDQSLWTDNPRIAPAKNFPPADWRPEPLTVDNTVITPLPPRGRCVHLGRLTSEKRPCGECGAAGLEVALHHCEIHSLCTIEKKVLRANGQGFESCCRSGECRDWQPKANPKPDNTPPIPVVPASPQPAIRWAYGITTVPSRRETLLPGTLKSLRAAGFDRPRLFVDGSMTGLEYRAMGPHGTDLEVTTHDPPLRAYGNWLVALLELFIREPRVHRYAIFQDDIMISKNTRAYLERLECPKNGYWNLCTFPENQLLAGGRVGFYPSRQNGRSATALVLSAEVVRQLFRANNIFDKILDPNYGHRKIDGAVVTALSDGEGSGIHKSHFCGPAGWREYVHNPSLVEHTGNQASSIGNEPYHPMPSWRGENFDALSLLKDGIHAPCTTC